MGKSTHRRGETNAEKVERPRISRKACRLFVRAKLAGKRGGCKRETVSAHKLQEVLHEETFECPICLQTFLWPVIAECGHTFCLPCAEKLAQHDYSCGMCHSFEPNYEIRVDSSFQQLVQVFLGKCPLQQRLKYEQRQKALQEMEASRRVDDLTVGDSVDFWSIEEKCWRSGMVQEITEDDQIVLCEPKGIKTTRLSLNSRRLAKHRHFTKEEPLPEPEPAARDPFTGNHPVFGMPMYINFFNHDPSPFNFGINDFINLMPGFRPYPF